MEKRKEMHPGQRALISQIDRELEREWRDERAAILEFEAGMTRGEADAAMVGRVCQMSGARPCGARARG